MAIPQRPAAPARPVPGKPAPAAKAAPAPASRPGAPAKKASFIPPKMNGGLVRQKAHQQILNFGGSAISVPNDMEMMKPKKGTSVHRIVPYIVTDPAHPDSVPVGSLWYKRPYKVHYNIGPDEKPRICLSTFGEPCPVCLHEKQLISEGASKEELKPFRAKKRDLFLLAPVDGSGPNELMDVSFYNFTEMLVREIDDVPEEREMFADLVDGMDIRVRWIESSMGQNNFTEADRIDFIARKTNYKDYSWWDNVPCLDDLLIRLTFEEFEAEFYGLAAPGSAPAEEPAPKAPKSAPGRKKAEPEPEPEVEEEIVEEVPATDEADFTPVFRTDDGEWVDAEGNAFDLYQDDSGQYTDAEGNPCSLYDFEYNPIDFEGTPLEQEPEVEPEPEPKPVAPPKRPAPKTALPAKAPAPAPQRSVPGKPAPAQTKAVPGKPAPLNRTAAAPAKKPAGKAAPASGEAVCPAGGSFGFDTNGLEACDSCALWDDCLEVFTNNRA